MEPNENQKRVIKQFTSKFKFELFKILKLPMAFLAGIKIVSIDNKHVTTSLKYKYLNKNPFQSVYFAVLNMGAELASGALAMIEIAKYKNSVSMLVTSAKSQYFKKATGKVYFNCKLTPELIEAIKKTIENDEPTTCVIEVNCLNEQQIEIGKYAFEWSFKKRDCLPR